MCQDFYLEKELDPVFLGLRAWKGVMEGNGESVYNYLP